MGITITEYAKNVLGLKLSLYQEILLEKLSVSSPIPKVIPKHISFSNTKSCKGLNSSVCIMDDEWINN